MEATSETPIVVGALPRTALPAATIPWGAVIAGAITAAAISSVLLSFGSAIGLSLVSTSPTWRDASLAFAVLSGLYLVFVSIASFGFGGYIAGRLRPRFFVVTLDELEFRDGLYGLLVWGGAIMLAGIVALGAASISSAATSTSNGANGTAAGTTLLAVQLDRLFRSDRPTGDADSLFRRDEASRILLTAGGRGVTNEDRDYLTAVVRDRAGISEPDAETRTNTAIADSRDAIARTRHAAVLEAFMIGAALLLGAAIAWFSACEGGRERETEAVPKWEWALRRRSTIVAR